MEDMSPIVYEEMCLSLYAYRLGTISFLEFVEQLEQVLGIAQPSGQCERVNVESVYPSEKVRRTGVQTSPEGLLGG